MLPFHTSQGDTIYANVLNVIQPLCCTVGSHKRSDVSCERSGLTSSKRGLTSKHVCVIASVCAIAIVDVHPHVSQIKTENKPRNAIQIGQVGDSYPLYTLFPL